LKSDTAHPRFSRHPAVVATSLAALVVLLASCSSASPGVSAAGSVAAAACAVTPTATSSATIEINSSNFGAAVTIAAGQAVTFTNKDSIAHTVTQGTNGTAVSGACVNEPIAPGASVIVTFNDAGDYDITCTIHHSMQTQVHVT
jgi:plastocyanin